MRNGGNEGREGGRAIDSPEGRGRVTMIRESEGVSDQVREGVRNGGGKCTFK